MIDHLLRLLIMFLLVFTPIAWGSMEIWAFSTMELTILGILVLWAIEKMRTRHDLSGSPVIQGTRKESWIERRNV